MIKILLTVVSSLIIALVLYLFGKNFFITLMIIGIIQVLFGALVVSDSASGTTPAMSMQNAGKAESQGMFNSSNIAPEHSKYEQSYRKSHHFFIQNRVQILEFLFKRDSLQLIVSGSICVIIGIYPFIEYFA